MAVVVNSIKNIKDKAKVALIEAFTELGHKAAIAAYRDARYNGKSYENRTFNLHDSYGSAVYVNGVLIEESIKFVNAGQSRKKDLKAPAGYENGRRALDTYFKTVFLVRKMDSYTILVAAAMWYASMLEKKGFTVIPYEAAKKHIVRNFDSVVSPILKKHKLEFLMPALRKGIGVDVEYFRFGGSRHPSE